MLDRGTSKLKVVDLRHSLEGNTLRFLFIKGRVWPSLMVCVNVFLYTSSLLLHLNFMKSSYFGLST